MTRPPQQYYDDGQVQLDRYALTLRRYHFPFRHSKVIPVRLIRATGPSRSGADQRFRIWGTSDLRRWLPLDIRRPPPVGADHPRRPGTWPAPLAFTPEDPEEFVAMFEAARAAKPTGSGLPDQLTELGEILSPQCHTPARCPRRRA